MLNIFIQIKVEAKAFLVNFKAYHRLFTSAAIIKNICKLELKFLPMLIVYSAKGQFTFNILCYLGDNYSFLLAIILVICSRNNIVSLAKLKLIF